MRDGLHVPEDAHDWLDEGEGQLALDVYQTAEEVIIKAPIAGVTANDLEVAVTEESVTIRGTRRDEMALGREAYYIQECFWGSFSRSYPLPVPVDPDRAEASLKDGILTIRIPKIEQSKTRLIQVQSAG